MSFVNLSDTHEPKGPEVFLDTSIFVSNQKGPLFTKRIKRVCDLFDWRSTSSYAKTEYGNVVLAPTEYILRLLKERGFAATVDWIAHILPSSYHLDKQIWGMTLLTRIKGSSEKEKTERAILSLTRMMKFGVRMSRRWQINPLKMGQTATGQRPGFRPTRTGLYFGKSPIAIDRIHAAESTSSSRRTKTFS